MFGTSAITALTAQPPKEFAASTRCPLSSSSAQVEAVLDDLPVAAGKTGMLATTDIVRAVADLAAAGRFPRLVVDPVMVASSGDRLLEPQAERLYLEALLPHAAVLTRQSARGRGPARRLDPHPRRATGGRSRPRRPRPPTVVVTGGHAVDDAAGEAIDLVWNGRTVHELHGWRIDTRNNHGTGCTFASATAAALATGSTVRDALSTAKRFVAGAITAGAAWRLGHGHGHGHGHGPLRLDD